MATKYDKRVALSLEFRDYRRAGGKTKDVVKIMADAARKTDWGEWLDAIRQIPKQSEVDQDGWPKE